MQEAGPKIPPHCSGIVAIDERSYRVWTPLHKSCKCASDMSIRRAVKQKVMPILEINMLRASHAISQLAFIAVASSCAQKAPNAHGNLVQTPRRANAAYARTDHGFGRLIDTSWLCLCQ